MKPLLYTGTLLLQATFASSGISAEPKPQRPNIIIILADDMGYSDVGCYGSEIPTPHIDNLAKNGIRFSRFYNTARCCPTRASLLTGLYQHQTGIGLMTTEAGNDFDFGVEGYKGYLNKKCVTIAEVLKDAGYHTYMTGKWHLGSDTLYKRPLERGFEKYFGSYQGAFSYFDPKGTRCLIDQTDTVRAPRGFYSTDAFADSAIQYIKRQKDHNPFFLYLAFNAPHWPLQAKEADIAKFAGKYTKGWDELRKARFARQVKSGLLKKEWGLSPRDNRVRPWDSVSAEQKILSDYRMAVYAAQIYCIDYNVGKLVASLKAQNKLDNTLIMFMSDNGACPEPYKEFGGGAQEDINNPDIAGAVSYGIGWANLSNTPWRMFKVNAEEGGISTPFIAQWPAHIKAQKGKITHTPGHIIDIMPTILDVTGAKYPTTKDGIAVQPYEGQSLLQAFETGERTPWDYQFWEHSNNCAVQHENWKAISRVGSDVWELYNLKTDRTELHNIASLYPDIVADLSTHWAEWAKRCKVLPKGVRTKNSYN